MQSQTGEREVKVEGDDNENVPESSNDLDPLRFHEELGVLTFPTLDEVKKYYIEHTAILRRRHGLLLFLYSVILSRVCLVGCLVYF